jgi:hypothetical protein
MPSTLLIWGRCFVIPFGILKKKTEKYIKMLAFTFKTPHTPAPSQNPPSSAFATGEM